MKKIAAAFLLLVFTIQLAHTALVYVWYYANKSYVANVLCENKNNKKMHCNGKCYLKKKITQAENEAGDHATVPVKKPVEPAPFIVKQCKEILVYFSVRPHGYGLYADEYSFTHLQDIFHPPSVS